MLTDSENIAEAADFMTDVRNTEALLKTGALQRAIFKSANFSSIATDAKGVIQIFNVGAERMLGYTAAEVMNKITPADISDPQELIIRAKALSAELGTPIETGWFVSGSVSVSGPTGHADVSIPLSGPRASGTLYGVADKSAGLWTFSLLELELEGRPGRIDLRRRPP